MYNYRFIRVIILLWMWIPLFYGCRKVDIHDPAQHCKILETSDRFFTYDDWGNPIRCTYKVDPDATGKPTSVFVYNLHHELIAYSGYNTHRLTLNAKGQAILDSLEMNYAGQDDQYVIQLFYDVFGRVSKEISTHYHSQGEDLPIPYPQEISYYIYDRRGNLIRPDTDGIGNLEYDNKTSLLRTHPVLMFVHRDYSLNNPKGATEYNRAGLPDTWYGTFLGGSGIEVNIIYDCDGRNGK